MTEEAQFYFNAAIGLGGLVIGWYIRLIWTEIKLLQRRDDEIAKDISTITVLVAGDYAKRDWIEAKLDRLFEVLGGINNKLDTKEDKHERRSDGNYP